MTCEHHICRKRCPQSRMRTKWTEYPLLVILYIYCPIINYYKYSDFKQHTYITTVSVDLRSSGCGFLGSLLQGFTWGCLVKAPAIFTQSLFKRLDWERRSRLTMWISHNSSCGSLNTASLSTHRIQVRKAK